MSQAANHCHDKFRDRRARRLLNGQGALPGSGCLGGGPVYAGQRESGPSGPPKTRKAIAET